MKKSLFSLILLSLAGILFLGSFSYQEIVLSPNEVAGGLTDAQKRGKTLYIQGISEGEREVTAMMSGAEVSATVLPCVNCHGVDGKGNPEGGVSPSNLTWPILTRNYQADHESGRSHPPYTEKTLKKAISMGLDPAGNELNVAMPRYRMSGQDMNDLIAYLKVIGEDTDPGILTDELRVGILLPNETLAPGKGEAMYTTLLAYAEQVNVAGGIYNRKLKVVPFSPPETEPGAALTEFLEEQEVYAFIGGELDPRDNWAEKTLNEAGVPMVGAIAGIPSESQLANRMVFYLYPGPNNEVKSLLQFGVDSLATQSGKIAVLYTKDELSMQNKNALDAYYPALGLDQIAFLEVNESEMGEAKMIKSFRKSGIEHVFLFADFEAAQPFFERAAKEKWYPQLYLPGGYGGPGLFELPTGFHNKVHLSYPVWPADQEPEMVDAFHQFSQQYELPRQYQQTQMGVLVSAILFSEVVKRCGRELSREKLVLELEKVWDFPTGLTRPLTFGLNRRVGADQVYIIRLNLEAKSLKWANPE